MNLPGNLCLKPPNLLQADDVEARTAAGEAVALLYDTCGLAELDGGSAQDSGCARCCRAALMMTLRAWHFVSGPYADTGRCPLLVIEVMERTHSWQAGSRLASFGEMLSGLGASLACCILGAADCPGL